MKTMTIKTPDGLTYTLSPAYDNRIVKVQHGYAVVACPAHRTDLIGEMRALGVVAPNTYVRVFGQGC